MEGGRTVMPVNNRMYSHKRRPASVRRIKERQVLAMRVRSSRSHKHSLDTRSFLKVYL